MKRNRSRICNVVHVIGIYNFSLSLALTASASFYNTEKMWYILLDISVSSQINKIHSGANTHRRKVSHVFRLFSQCRRLSKTSEQEKISISMFLADSGEFRLANLLQLTWLISSHMSTVNLSSCLLGRCFGCAALLCTDFWWPSCVCSTVSTSV